jgi:hypothetical protein
MHERVNMVVLFVEVGRVAAQVLVWVSEAMATFVA